MGIFYSYSNAESCEVTMMFFDEDEMEPEEEPEEDDEWDDDEEDDW
jgi:hypothetical protein